MIQKPEQYYDKRRHQLYYQWSESEYFSHQEPIYDRTREYIESLEAENAKLRGLIGMIGNVCDGTSEVCEYCKNYSAKNDECMMLKQIHELGIEENE